MKVARDGNWRTVFYLLAVVCLAVATTMVLGSKSSAGPELNLTPSEAHRTGLQGRKNPRYPMQAKCITTKTQIIIIVSVAFLECKYCEGITLMTGVCLRVWYSGTSCSRVLGLLVRVKSCRLRRRYEGCLMLLASVTQKHWLPLVTCYSAHRNTFKVYISHNLRGNCRVESRCVNCSLPQGLFDS